MSDRPEASGPRPVVAALLAGGKGTRFWPASRARNPKQFLTLFGDRSLLRRTFDRFGGHDRRGSRAGELFRVPRICQKCNLPGLRMAQPGGGGNL